MVAALVAEGRTHAGGDALPILSFLLAELWAERSLSRRLLTAAALGRLGGAGEAIARHGDTVLSLLAADERRAARRILLGLLTPGETRARRLREELVAAGDGTAERALEALVHGRIVVAGEGYEIAHEALVRAWPKLRGWLDEASDERAAARRLAERRRPSGSASDAIRGCSGAHGRHETSIGPHRSTGPARSRARSRRRAAGRCGGRDGCGSGSCWRCRSPWRSRARSCGAYRTPDTAPRSPRRSPLRGSSTRRSRRARAPSRDVRARAFAAFEKDDLGPAEALWKEALAREEDTDRQRREVLAAVGGALARDPRDLAARALAADVALARLLAAERLHKKTLLGALGAELDVHDDGSRRAWLRAPAHVTAGPSLRAPR